LPAELPAIAETIQTGQPQYIRLGSSRTGQLRSRALLRRGKSQIGLPIQQEGQTIGIMLLESVSSEESPAETVAFLSRLVDHAAIAIANAQLYNQVDAANQAKVEFVKFVAHELKNPMSSIKGYTELVLNGAAGSVNEMQAQFLKTVRSNVDRMDTIVSDLNDVTKIESGKLDLKFNTIQVAEIVDDTARSLTRLIQDKSQTLVIDIPETLPKVWADPVRLTQIITNLISNAHKYTPVEGEIQVGARLADLHDLPGETTLAGAAANVRFVHIWVQDTGIGISPEDQKKIFQQYFRTSLSKEMASGTGLGLNITKSLVEMQGGRIWFESEPHFGTTFHITVPVAEEA
jgi:signal transduction histidine kinase